MRHLFVCVCKVLSAHAHTLTQKHSHIGQQAKGQTFVSQLQNGSAFCSHPPFPSDPLFTVIRPSFHKIAVGTHRRQNVWHSGSNGESS